MDRSFILIDTLEAFLFLFVYLFIHLFAVENYLVHINKIKGALC